MSNSRIPINVPEFNGYITDTNNYLQAGPPTNGTRLGLSAFMTEWNDKQKDWEDLCVLSLNRDTNNHTNKENIKHFIHDFRAFANPILNMVAANPDAIDADATTFNLVLDKNHAAPSHVTAPIVDTVMAEVKPIGGGDALVTCRTHTDDKHASKHAGADSVQIAYKIDGDVPVSVLDAPHKDLSTKARFLMHLGPENGGKKVYFFMRWFNTKHPGLAGPWGQMIVINLA